MKKLFLTALLAVFSVGMFHFAHGIAPITHIHKFTSDQSKSPVLLTLTANGDKLLKRPDDIAWKFFPAPIPDEPSQNTPLPREKGHSNDNATDDNGKSTLLIKGEENTFCSSVILENQVIWVKESAIWRYDQTAWRSEQINENKCPSA